MASGNLSLNGGAGTAAAIGADEANRLKPGAFLPRKIAFTLAGADPAKRARIAADLDAYIQRHDGTPPKIEDIRKAVEEAAKADIEGDAEEDITEAEIVGEGAEEDAATVAGGDS